MAEAANAPAGWTQDVACVLEKDGRAVLGENGQVGPCL
jgi:hypothetical protein